MNNWWRLTSQTDEVIPPEQILVRGIDVLPHHYGIWCTVGDGTKAFANEIVNRRWSEDGSKIWVMLDTHNFDSFDPDEMVRVVPLDPKDYGEAIRAKWDQEAADFLSKRPKKKEPPMTPTEKKLVARLLDVAADQFSNHGCNDFDLVKDGGLTSEESQEIQQEIHRWKNDPDARPPSADHHYVMDWMVMRMLAARFKATKDG